MLFSPTYLDRPGLLQDIRSQLSIDPHGIHGLAHWSRVQHHGSVLAEACGADRLVVELFGWLHDCRRENEDHDPEHGSRAVDYIRVLNGCYFSLDRHQFETLRIAVSDHSKGLMHDDPTIQCCWDADRLDLGRVGIKPDPAFLSPCAHGLIDNANRMSRDWVEQFTTTMLANA